jgi:hypothetical protein
MLIDVFFDSIEHDSRPILRQFQPPAVSPS